MISDSNQSSQPGRVRQAIRLVAPGLLAVIVLAIAADIFARWFGCSILGYKKSPVSAGLVAIVFGLLVGNLVPKTGFMAAGASFAAKRILRLGIVLLGFRLSVMALLTVGAHGLAIVMGCIAAGLSFTMLVSHLLKVPQKLGVLIGVGTSICGVSAITAAGPAIDAEEEDISYAVSVITLFGIAATLIYPYLANILFAGDPQRVGLFLGTAIHDTSQVTGAALVYADTFQAPKALDVATVTKLLRNLFMAVVIPLSAWLHTRQSKDSYTTGKKKGIASFFPLFVLGFVVMTILRSIGDVTQQSSGQAYGLLGADVWKSTIGLFKNAAGWLLVIALAGVGLKTRFNAMKKTGPKPFFVGLAAALVVGVVSVTLIQLLGALLWKS